MRPTRLAALLLAPAPLLARPARACLNDFEIQVAEQQLRGAYATAAAPVTEAAPWPLVAAILGGLALAWALWQVGRVA